jgi:hypothetical protein
MLRVLENGVLSETFGSKNRSAGNCTSRSFMIHHPHQILLEQSDQGTFVGRGKWYVWGKGYIHIRPLWSSLKAAGH